MEKVSIKVRAYEAKLVDETAKKIALVAVEAGAKVSGPVPLPTKRELFTILRSTHVNKKSREQFERKTHQRLVVLTNVNDKLKEALERLDLPYGVGIELKIK